MADRPRVHGVFEYTGPDPEKAVRPDLASALKEALRYRHWRCVELAPVPEESPGAARNDGAGGTDGK